MFSSSLDIKNTGNTNRECLAGGSWRVWEAICHKACFIHCWLHTLPDNVIQVCEVFFSDVLYNPFTYS